MIRLAILSQIMASWIPFVFVADHFHSECYLYVLEKVIFVWEVELAEFTSFPSSDTIYSV